MRRAATHHAGRYRPCRAHAELVLAHLVARAQEVHVRYLWRPNLRDEGDNFVLEIAVAAWPCTLVTHNLADFARGQLRFPQIPITTPGSCCAA